MDKLKAFFSGIKLNPLQTEEWQIWRTYRMYDIPKATYSLWDKKGPLWEGDILLSIDEYHLGEWTEYEL